MQTLIVIQIIIQVKIEISKLAKKNQKIVSVLPQIEFIYSLHLLQNIIKDIMKY